MTRQLEFETEEADSAERPQKLFLLDGMALTYRAHFALIRSPRFTTSGLCTSAVFGLANTLLDITGRESPTHMVAAFDTEEPTARHEEFEAYKAQRDKLPEDIEAQLPWIDRLLEAFRIRSLRIPGYEADDILGTLAHRAARERLLAYLVTSDKDFDQLVSDRVFVYRPGRRGSEYEILGVPEVLEKWQIERVDQVIDILGLMGDASDNIPGVPGIGPKTAQKLIAKYGTIENLIAHADELKGKQKERIKEFADQALLSKRLVTIQLDVPVDVAIEDLKWPGYDEKALKKLFQELEFDTLGKRLFGSSFSSSATRAQRIREKREVEIQKQLFDDPEVEERTIADVKHTYHVVRTASERKSLLAKLAKSDEYCFDTETTGLDARVAEPIGLAFALTPETAYYVVCPRDSKKLKALLEEFRAVLEDDSKTKIGHNLKYDMTVLRWHDIRVPGPIFDTMLAHSMKEPEMRHGLDYLARLYLGYQPISITKLAGTDKKSEINLAEIDVDKVAEYACEDADVTLQIANVLKPELEAQGVAQVCYEVEFPLTPVLVDMEFQGIRLDVDAIKAYSKKLEQEIEELKRKIFEAAGHEFNIDSPKQLGVVLYDELKLEANPKRTPTGQYSTRESELERLASRHTIIADILDYRNAVKLKSVYVDQLPNYVDPRTGRIHTRYDQTWTSTGRIQSADPNLQTIPIRKKRGREIRAAFVPRDENYLILSADYSQIELRVMADISGDEAMIQAFRDGLDIHAATAAKVFKVGIDEVTREMRDKAKTVNFGIIYGISAFGLQQRLNIPKKEAQELINGYYREYPGVKKYIDETIAFAREHGYVVTRTGRRRFLRDINSRNRSLAAAAERLAMNSPIQGTAADLLKLAMIKVFNRLEQDGFQTKMLLTVHDELVFDLHKEERETAPQAIETAMKSAMELKVPLEVEIGIGQNWLEAH